MCLDKVESREDTGPGIGYKLFSFHPITHKITGFYCPDYTFNPPGQINIDENNAILNNDSDEEYEAGYHIYTNKKSVENYIRICKQYKAQKDCYFNVYKVSYDKVVATGFDGFRRAVVAKEMTILEELT